QGEELVVAASVERELLDLMLIDDAGGFLRGEVNAGRRGADDDLLADRLDTESEVHLEALPDDKRDAALFLRGKTTAADGDGVAANGDRRRSVATIGSGCDGAGVAGVKVAHNNSGPGDGGLAGIGDDSMQGCANDLRMRGKRG